MKRDFRVLAGSAALCSVAACASLTGGGGDGPPNPGAIADRAESVKLMMVYDSNGDGKISRAEMEEGLKREFAAADKNGDGRLDGRETQDENDRRWRLAGTEASPIMDWNQDGYVSFEEFATTARSVFAELDKDMDGMLAGNELRVPRPRGQGRPMRTAGAGGNRRPGG